MYNPGDDVQLASRLLGVPGMPGLTAYMDLPDIGQPKTGDTVVLAGASGAVGSLVGQIDRIQGARALGIAGGAKKCRYVVDQLGFDACIDHHGAPTELGKNSTLRISAHRKRIIWGKKENGKNRLAKQNRKALKAGLYPSVTGRVSAQ